MKENDPATTFRGLPLTPEQDSEIKHYIYVRQRCGTSWDTPELLAMIADMLHPPEVGDEDGQALQDSVHAQQATARDEAGLDGRPES